MATRAATGDPTRAPELMVEELTADATGEMIQAAMELLLEYGRFVEAQPGVTSFCFGTLEQEAACLPHSYLEQGGGALLACRDGRPIGFVAWRMLPVAELARAWEIKRLWIRPEARGSGLGRVLMQEVIDRARAAGKAQLLLDTAPESMASALRLYREMGFQECAAYNGRAVGGILYMQKAL